MKLEINITKRYVWMLSAVIVLVGAALFVMAQTAPNAGGVWHALQTISTGSTGAVSVDADGNGVIDLAGNATQRAGMSFEVYNADTTTYACIKKDLKDSCGDFDGCTIRVLMQHEIDQYDQVRIIDENIYMEQDSLAIKKGAGVHGWTRQSGGGDYDWITGMTNKYTIFSPWDWVWVRNYDTSVCQGRTADSAAHTNPYDFTFMSHPHVRTNFIVYD